MFCRKRFRQQLRLKSVEDDLGLPPKPKKPIVPFCRFAIENRPSIMAKHPTLKSYEIDKILATMWQSMDASDRENYRREYRSDLIKYFSTTEYTKCRASLSDDDKRKIKEMKLEMKNRQALVAQQRKLRKLGKPKKPLPSFLRFLAEQTDRKLKEPYKEYVMRVTKRWDDLSEMEKEKYKTPPKEEAAYK